MAATSYRDIMTQLTLTNKQLVQANQRLADQLSKALAELAQHKKPTTHNPNQQPQ
jgi:hypothetical protein